MFKQLILTTAGWIAAFWTKKGLAVLILPPQKREKALFALNEKLSCWEYRDNDPQIENDQSLFLDSFENTLVKYFQGIPVNFDLPVDLSWCTTFQKKVLTTIRQIPYGEVRSYGQVAAAAGYPGAARAAGRTAGLNRTPIVIPCHRVIRQNKEPGGFSAGPEMKKYLLELESAKNKV